MAYIEKLKNGHFKATVSMGRLPNGKQNKKTITRDNEGECKHLARQMEQDYEDGLGANVQTIRFSKWVDEWFELKKNEIAPSTRSSYLLYIDTHFKPFFGNIKVSQIDEIVIKRYVSTKLKTLSSTTVRKHFYVLSSILEILKHKNPCKYLKAPEKADYEYRLVTDDDYNQILEFFRGRQYEPIIMLGAEGGMRRGEIYNLKWNDIDFENKTIRIDEALSINEEGLYEEKDTKSKNGMRTIAVPDGILTLLENKKHSVLSKLQNKQSNIKIHPASINNNRIFPARPDSFSKYFEKCMKKIGLGDIRFHDLRHFHATWLYENDIPDLFAAQRLGDDPATIKKVYQHIRKHKEKELNKIILEKLNSPKKDASNLELLGEQNSKK